MYTIPPGEYNYTDLFSNVRKVFAQLPEFLNALALFLVVRVIMCLQEALKLLGVDNIVGTMRLCTQLESWGDGTSFQLRPFIAVKKASCCSCTSGLLLSIMRG